jgi:hydrogenase-4 component E
MMNPTSILLIKVLFVFILGTAALIIMQKSLTSLFSIYGVQSLLMAVVSLVLFKETGSYVLLAMAILTVITKVVIIPYMLNRVRKDSGIHRDAEFRYLTPVSAIMVGMALIFIIYSSFYRVLRLSQDNLFLLGAVIGVSLAMLGMLVIFSRKKIVTKAVGYLMMENGVLLFGLFIAELPFIIELFIIVDLVIFILLATILSMGIDSTEGDFTRKLNDLTKWFKE